MNVLESFEYEARARRRWLLNEAANRFAEWEAEDTAERARAERARAAERARLIREAAERRARLEAAERNYQAARAVSTERTVVRGRPCLVTRHPNGVVEHRFLDF